MTGSPPYSQEQKNIGYAQQNLANQQQQYAGTLEAPITTGVLPPGPEAEVDQAKAAALAATRSKFANLDLGNSTMETSAEGDVATNILALKGKIEEMMAGLGLQSSGQAGQSLSGAENTFGNVATQQITQDDAFMQAIAGFADALAGGAAKGAFTKPA